MAMVTATTRVDSFSSPVVGFVHLRISSRTCRKNPRILLNQDCMAASVPFRSLRQVARQEGLEPPTDGFGDRYSTN